MENYKQQFKEEFVKFAEIIADKIIEAYSNATLPDSLKQAAGDIDILKMCISSSIERWKSNMTSLSDAFKSNMNNEEFLNSIKEKINEGVNK